MNEEPSYDIDAWRGTDAQRYEEVEWKGIDRFAKDMVEVKLQLQDFNYRITPRWPFGVGFYEDWDYE